MPGFIFAVSVTAADSSWRAHAHLTPCQRERARAETGAEGRSNAEIATRPVPQLMKCHVCLVLITANKANMATAAHTEQIVNNTPVLTSGPKPLIQSPQCP